MISYTSRRNFIFFGYFSGNVKFRLFIEVFRYIFIVFLRCLTHSVRRYSICPFTERKSSSAHAAIALYKFSLSRSGICFFAMITFPLTKLVSTDFRSSLPAARHDCRTVPQGDWKPSRPFSLRRDPPHRFPSGVREPFQPCRPRRRQSSCARQ